MIKAWLILFLSHEFNRLLFIPSALSLIKYSNMIIGRFKIVFTRGSCPHETQLR